jgi:hypothetical protein
MTMKKTKGKKSRPRTTVVWSLFWDSEGPGAGADYELALKKGGRYFLQCTHLDEDDPERGPYQTLDEAVEAGGLAQVTSATRSIRSTERTTWEIMAMLETFDFDPEDDGCPLLVNGELFIFDGTAFRPATGEEQEEAGNYLPDPEAVRWMQGRGPVEE